jgi:hypothetical protein
MLIACSEDDPAKNATSVPEIPCDFRHELVGGYPCAVAPSATGADISDEFGYHAIGVPDGISASGCPPCWTGSA